jgi:hypothetical protein
VLYTDSGLCLRFRQVQVARRIGKEGLSESSLVMQERRRSTKGVSGSDMQKERQATKRFSVDGEQWDESGRQRNRESEGVAVAVQTAQRRNFAQSLDAPWQSKCPCLCLPIAPKLSYPCSDPIAGCPPFGTKKARSVSAIIPNAALEIGSNARS